MGSVYAFQDGSGKRIKFGRSKDPEQRVRDGRTFDPGLRQLEVIDVDDAYTSKCETYLHKSLRTKRYSRELYAITADEARLAMREASAYFTEFVPLNEGVTALMRQESDGRLLSPSDEERELFRKYIEAREKEDKWTARRELLENKLKVAIGRAAGLEGLLTWKSIEVRRFDYAGLKEAEPELYERWTKPRLERRLQLLNDPVDDDSL